jgi:hypothetical protein
MAAALASGRELAPMEVESLARRAVEGELAPEVAAALALAFVRRAPTGGEVAGLARVLGERARRPLFGGGGALVSLSAPVGPWWDGALLAAAAGLRVALLVDDPLPALAWGLTLPLAADPLDEPAEAARLLARSRFTALLAAPFHPDLAALAPFGDALRQALCLVDPSRAHLRLLVAPGALAAEAWARALERQHLDRAEVWLASGGMGWCVEQGRASPFPLARDGEDPTVACAAALLALAGWGEGPGAAARLASQAREDGREAQARGRVSAGERDRLR